MKMPLLVGLAVVSLVGCAAPDDSNAPVADQSYPAPAETTTVEDGAGWRTVARTIDGDSLDLAELDGEQVLFWFWAPY